MKNNKLAILGHKNPDVDSILSGYILSNYLRYKRYEADYVIPDKEIDEESKEIVESFGVNVDYFLPRVIDDDKLILVDHHETEFSNEVLAVIDHHPTIKKFNYPVYKNEPYSSTTKHIHNIILKESPDYITRRFVELVVVGLLVDTNSFRSAKTQAGDKEWFEEMCVKYDFNRDELLKVGDCLTDTSDIKKASKHGFKSYNYFGKSVASSYIQTNTIDIEVVNNIVENLKEVVKKDSLYMWVFIVVDLKTSTSLVYEIYQDDVINETYDFMVSRGTNIMPKIEKKIGELVETL